jgi:hypothetical protein
MRAEGQRGEELTRDMVYIPIREIAYTPEHLNSRVSPNTQRRLFRNPGDWLAVPVSADGAA